MKIPKEQLSQWHYNSSSEIDWNVYFIVCKVYFKKFNDGAGVVISSGSPPQLKTISAFTYPIFQVALGNIHFNPPPPPSKIFYYYLQNNQITTSVPP